MILLRVISTGIMVLTFSFIVDNQLELKPEIIRLILRTRFLKAMEALGQGMTRVGLAMTSASTSVTQVGVALEGLKPGDLVVKTALGWKLDWRVQSNGE